MKITIGEIRKEVMSAKCDDLQISVYNSGTLLLDLVSITREYVVIQTIKDLKDFFIRHTEENYPGIDNFETNPDTLMTAIFWANKKAEENIEEDEGDIICDPEMVKADQEMEMAPGISMKLNGGVRVIDGSQIFGNGKDPVKALKEIQQKGMRDAFMDAIEDASGQKMSPEVRAELEKELKEVDDNRDKNEWELRENRKNNPQVRYAKAGMTVADLEDAIKNATDDSCCGHIYPNDDCHFLDDVLADVGVDFENNERFYDPEILNGVPVAWCRCGGDWECPLFYCLYIGEDGELHAYVPKDGNTYNQIYNCAFGSESDYKRCVPEEVWKKTFQRGYGYEDEDPEENLELMREDVKKWIKIRKD